MLLCSFHFDQAGFDLTGRALGHAFVGAHVAVGRVLDHQRSVVQHLVLAIATRSYLITANQVHQIKVNFTIFSVFVHIKSIIDHYY